MNLFAPAWWSMSLCQSHIYPGFMGKDVHINPLLTWTRQRELFLFGPGSWALWEQFGFYPHNSINTPELDTSLDEADAMASSVTSGFLCLVNTVPSSSRPQLGPSIKSCKLWCQTRGLYLPVLQAGKMLASKLICYFSGHLAAFGFWSSLLPSHQPLWELSGLSQRLGSALMIKSGLYQSLLVPPRQGSCTLILSVMFVGGRIWVGGASTSTTDPRKKETMGMSFLMCHSHQLHHHHLHLLCSLYIS